MPGSGRARSRAKSARPASAKSSISSMTLRRTMGSKRDAQGRRAERQPEGSPQPGVNRRIHPGHVAGRQEQLIGVVDVVAATTEARRVRLPVLGRGLDVVEPRQGPEVRALLVIERRLVAKTPVDRVRIVESDQRIPVNGGQRVHQVTIEPKLNHSRQGVRGSPLLTSTDTVPRIGPPVDRLYHRWTAGSNSATRGHRMETAARCMQAHGSVDVRTRAGRTNR